MIRTFINSEDQSKVLVLDQYYETVLSCWFNPEYWLSQDKIIGQSTGRSTTYFFTQENKDYVLRHYYRGGFIRKLSRDRYVYTGIERTRAVKELKLLMQLADLDLPAPRAVAVQVQQQFFCYTADIIMEKIAGACDLYQHLSKQALGTNLAQAVGAVSYTHLTLPTS